MPQTGSTASPVVMGSGSGEPVSYFWGSLPYLVFAAVGAEVDGVAVVLGGGAGVVAFDLHAADRVLGVAFWHEVRSITWWGCGRGGAHGAASEPARLSIAPITSSAPQIMSLAAAGCRSALWKYPRMVGAANRNSPR